MKKLTREEVLMLIPTSTEIKDFKKYQHSVKIRIRKLKKLAT